MRSVAQLRGNLSSSILHGIGDFWQRLRIHHGDGAAHAHRGLHLAHSVENRHGDAPHSDAIFFVV